MRTNRFVFYVALFLLALSTSLYADGSYWPGPIYPAFFVDGPVLDEKGKPSKYKDRNLYPSDETFANFREVHTTGIAPHRLYRSCSPLVSGKRGKAALGLLEQYNIQFVINLSNVQKDIISLAEDKPYYNKLAQEQKVVAYDMQLPVKYLENDFAEQLREVLLFIAGHPSDSYLIHCQEGKDRTGIVCALLEALTGATMKEIKADFCLSFNMYYHYPFGSSWYKERELIVETLFTDINKGLPVSDKNLRKVTESYLYHFIRLSRKDIEALKNNLTKSL
ncbi:MAG: tyrosine-protein phosphatase [Treponema sp.]|nr:tyrosine-protein phosphatase [Treponema sp.]